LYDARALGSCWKRWRNVVFALASEEAGVCFVALLALVAVISLN
jgi:hypothetical protein